MIKQASGFFVTGTDTEVGKTLVAGALLQKLQQAGQNPIGFKPVVAGTYKNADGVFINEDLETFKIATGSALNAQDLCPYILDTPAAPHLVAEKQGLPLDLNVIIEALQKLSEQFDSVVVEGAGGLLVPLNAKEDLGHLAQAINMPIILVVGMRLGCINHALLTYEVLKLRQIPVAGWIANSLNKEMPLLEENLQTLKERMQSPLLGVIPALPKHLEKQANAPYSLAALQFAAKHIALP